MAEKSFVIKGNICQTHPKTLALHENAVVVCMEGISIGIFHDLPVYDYGNSLTFPSMVDLHVHAPQ